MFQKIDVYVVLVLTNIIIGQLNTKLYDSDNGIPKFCICENLETHFHLVFFERWHAIMFKVSGRSALNSSLRQLKKRDYRTHQSGIEREK